MTNPPETHPESDLTATYFDPEAMDTSEQEFSASLEEPFEPPRFVVDAPADVTPSPEVYPGAELEPESEPRQEDGAPNRAEDNMVHSEEEPDWRNLVSAKVNNYKSRRPQKDRYPSLRLPFEPDSWGRGKSDVADIISAVPDEPPVPEPVVPAHYQPIVLESTARILEFPRTAPNLRSDELAEPVMERPRIVEAPELLPPPPAMGGILIESARELEMERRPGIDFPLQLVSISRRIAAAVLDTFVIASALTAFGYIFLRMNSTMPPLRETVELAAGLLFIMWPAYQFCFLVFTGSTPGLRFAKLQVSHFDGSAASRKLRRWRVLASLLSWISLGLGYVWCFMDEDQLCWHDRITKTYLARH